MSSMSNLSDRASDAPEMTLYWRPGCGFCARLEGGLSKAGVTYARRNIWDDPEAADFVRGVNNGNETVPTVVIDKDVYTNPPASLILERLGIESEPSRAARFFRRGD